MVNKTEFGANILAFLFIFGLMLAFLYFPIRSTIIQLDFDDVCKYNYGEDYIFIRDEYFGTYCIELVHENLTKINPEPYDWDIYEIKEMCDVPGFFDLTRWDRPKCKGEFALKNNGE